MTTTQWANMDDLKLVEDIKANSFPSKLLFIGGYRSNEASADVLQNDGCTLTIEIHALTVEDVHTYLCDTLELEQEKGDAAMPLSELVFETTGGNVFYVRQYIDFLYRNGHIFFSLPTLSWQWEDLAVIQDTNRRVGGGDIEKVLIAKLARLVRSCCIYVKADAVVVAGSSTSSLLTYYTWPC